MAEMAAAAWAAVKAASAYVVGSMKAVAAGTATAGQVATYVAVTVGGSMAMSAAAQALMKPNVGGRAPGEWVADPNAGIPFAIGPRIGVGGNIVYKNTWGKDNEYKGIVSVVSGAGPITGYLGFTADKEAVTFSGDAATGRYSGQMWMRRTMGNQPDVALSDPSMPGWGANYKLSGKASFLWVLKQDSKFSVYPQGEPSPIHVLSGIKGYDHRFDDTFPGGSGPCRLGVPATYRPITNPIIADLNWCLGLKENGKVVGGLGVSPAGIHWAAYTRAANIADANGWVVAALPRSDEPKSEVRAAFLQAGGAVISRQAGLISCVSRGAPKSPVMTISAADTAGPIELDTAANVLNRLNQITPRYLSEAHDWQLVAAAPVTSSVYLTEDRGRLRSDQRDYPYVPNAKQAAELAALDLANTREGIAGRWPLKAFCRDLEPGDVFTVDEPGMLLDGMDFLVLHREFEPATSTVYVTFVSETAGKVEWALGRTPNPPPTPALSARVDLSPPASGDWSVALPTPVPGNVQVPTATITITIDNARAEGLIVEKGPSSTGPWRQIKEVAINGTTLTVPLYDLAPNEVFWLALSYRAADTGLSVRGVKGPFTAGDLVAGDTTHLKGEPVQDVLDRLVGVEAISASNQTAVSDLEEVYGDTVSAAQSAAEAAAAAANAITAKADAIIASSEAEGFSTAASDAATAAAGDAASALSSKNAAATSASNAATSASNASGHASTASTQAGAAAASATDAANRATAAAGSATTASTKATEAGNSASAANAAKVSAESARDAASGSASAASGSASSAATSATNAGTSASAANTAKTAAETAKGQAQTFATNAADSATTAQGAATTATSQAGLATTAKNNAESASTAAVNARNQASSFADAADVASSAATNASVSADLAAATTLPSRPGDGLKYFTGSLAGLPSASAPLASTVSVASVAGVGAVAETSVPNWIITKGWVPIGVGRVHEVVVRVRVSADGATPNRTQYGFRLTNAAGLNGGSVVLGATHVAADGFIELRYTRTSAQLQAASADSTHFRVGAMVAVQTGSISASGATVQVAEVRYRDITEAQAAETQALAAATSASNASASQTAAGISATAANTAKTAAETARGQAQTAATNASNSATNAAGSASSASTSASNAATSRDQASGFATAASGSASTASTKAGDAEISAAAAAASQVSASTAQSAATFAAVAALPATISSALWTAHTSNGQGSARADLSASHVTGNTFTGNISAGPKQRVPWVEGAIYELRSLVTAPASAPGIVRHIVAQADVGFAHLTWNSVGSGAVTIPAGTTQEVVTRVSLGVTYPGATRVIRASGAEWVSFAINNNLSGVSTIRSLSVKDVTGETKSGDSASSAATSAANASASESQAGASAVAASNSATSANTRAGDALTYAGQAASSAANAQAASITAGTAASTASDAAATATSQASSASASAASASLSAEAASGVSVNANLMPNGSGENGTEGWFSPLSGFYAADWAPFGGRILKQDLVGTIPVSYLNGPRASVESGQVVTLSWRGWLENFSGTALVYLVFRNAANEIVWTSPTTTIHTQTGKITSQPAPATAKQAHLVIVVNGTGSAGAGLAITRAKIENGSIATAYTTDKTDVNLQASLNIAASTAVDVANRMSSVSFGVTGGAGADPFEILMKAGPEGSMATVSATAILLRNIIAGNAVEALKLINGEAYFGAPVSVTVTDQRLTIGPGFGVSAGLVMWFGPTGTAIAAMSRINGYFALGTDGKVYYGSAELPSGGGGGGGGAAFNRASVASSISGTSWQTISSITFNGKPSGGWWQAGVTGLGGYADGINNTDVEFRIIESGASSPLATSWPVTIQAGMTGPVEEPAFSPDAPWAQTRPAGDLTLLLQARQTTSFGTFTHLTSGNFVINYTPGA